MKMIRTCEFARMAGIRPETAWRIATSGALPSAQRAGKLWRISYADARKWIESRAPKNSITPESAAKIIGCSGAHVRKLLAKNKLSFAQQRPNRRWVLRDGQEFQAWALREKQILAFRATDKYKLLAGLMRWMDRVGGEEAILSWPERYACGYDVLSSVVKNLQPIRDLVNRAEMRVLKNALNVAT